MPIFRRRDRPAAPEEARDARESEGLWPEGPDAAAEEDVAAEAPEGDEAASADAYGPYDETELPEDEIPRLDLGSVRIPVPDGAQLQVEMAEEGGLQAVHLLTDVGQFTLSAFAAPRSASLWPEVCDELAEALRSDGTAPRVVRGEWGQELTGAADELVLRFLGVDGPRWMLRGVAACPKEHATEAEELLHELARHTIVVRGEDPMPVGNPLPVSLPEEIAEQVQAAQAEQVQAAQAEQEDSAGQQESSE
jgi:hypothetical protein